MREAFCRIPQPQKNGKKKDTFFPGKGETAEEAIAKYCFKCTVQEECDDYANRIGATVGVWGGKRRVRKEQA